MKNSPELLPFKPGDKLCCTCGAIECRIYFTFVRFDKPSQNYVATNESGQEDYFPSFDSKLVLETVYKSPLYNALKEEECP